ncbi:MAG: DNA recombination protein RmuC [Ruminococcaceae bacterium]|nr:DNA recombination protein RmuC [Oscillospiraceae bacterium]
MDRLGRSLTESQKEQSRRQDERLIELIKTQNQIFTMQDKRLVDMQNSLTALLSEKMDSIGGSVSQKLSDIDKQFRELREQNRKEQEELRRILEERLLLLQTQNAQQMEKMQAQNAKQLDEMRATVDEKLQKTLDERISQSFKMVNERLAEVYKGLGEMQTLAGSVGDLKKVISGVKTRGILGELQLGAIIEEMLTPEQYAVNIPTKRGSQNRVEYAIRLPGDDAPIYIPIDAKFPADAYTHLLDAYEQGDPDKIKEAGNVFERRIKDFAKDIRDKYIDPPNTTSFGIMFLPFEGLYAEVVRRGMIETLQRQYQISVAGPTTFSALLNSLQMGFRTLAIQKRSGEVWEVLSAVKTEFNTFGKVLAKAQERIEQTSKELDTLVGVRTRKINSKLRAVSELPAAEAQVLIDTGDAEEE